MKKLLACLVVLFVAACSNTPPSTSAPGESETPPAASLPSNSIPPGPPAASRADTLNAYKVDLAQRIAQANAARIYEGRPQALLRSVIVLRYSVDGQGNLVHSEILRSNRDRANEQTALASLKSAAPFPSPAGHLLRHGRVDVSESWLFNNDGRFQLRSIAPPQMDE